MLRKLLATSALVVIGAVLIQSANAADDLKSREIVIEPAGSHAPDAAGLPTSGVKTENLVGKAGDGAPGAGPAANAGAVAAAANSAAIGNKTPVEQLLVTPPSGAATPPAGVIANPSGTAVADSGAPAAGAAPASPVAAAAVPTAPAAAVPAAAPITAVKSAGDLEKLLTGHGYGVEVSQQNADGNEMFYVTIPGDAQQAYLLTVDSYGKVKETQRISGYGHHNDDAPSYGQAYGGNDNCNYGTGYNAGY
jgi:hypothetical protein